MTTNILPSPRKLKLNTSKHRRSPHQLYTSSGRHHPGKRVSGIIPCTCSDSHIIAQPGTPCLVDVLLPSPDSLYRRSKRYGFVSPISHSSRSTASTSLTSLEELFEESQYDTPFKYYLPHISSNSVDCYVNASGGVVDIREPDELAETEEMLLNDFDLPFVQDDDFNYYPELSPRSHGPYSAVDATTEESLVLGNELKHNVVAERVKAVKKAPRHFSIRILILKLLKRLGLKR